MKVGFIGWRGWSAPILMSRMEAEGDFDGLDAQFFSTSNPGGAGPRGTLLGDATDLTALSSNDVLLSCQGGAYTESVVPRLRAQGWDGVWIDAASTLRMDTDTTLVLDPVNGADVQQAIADSCRTFVGANCTVSLLLMSSAACCGRGMSSGYPRCPIRRPREQGRPIFESWCRK